MFQHASTALPKPRRGPKGPTFVPRPGCPTREPIMADELKCVLGHDLLNKVGVIVGYCDLLLANPDPPSQQSAEHIQRIKAAALDMAEQIKQRDCPIDATRAAKAAGV